MFILTGRGMVSTIDIMIIIGETKIHSCYCSA
jgi:hypothetical protein